MYAQILCIVYLYGIFVLRHLEKRIENIQYKSSHPKVFCKKDAFISFTKSTEQSLVKLVHLCHFLYILHYYQQNVQVRHL